MNLPDYRTPSGVVVHRAGPRAGSLARAVARATEGRRGNAVVVTSPSVARENDLLAEVRAALRPDEVIEYSGAAANVPEGTVQEVVDGLRATDASLIVSLGGASSIDTAKAAVHRLLGDRSRPRHITIPSTLGGAEFTPFAGVTIGGVKRPVRAPELTPDAVVHSVAVLARTPPQLLAESLTNAVSHCLEGLISPAATPVSVALQERALDLLVAGATGDRTNPDVLARIQEGAALAAMLPVPMGIAHALVHTIVAETGTRHGATHGVVAAAVARYNEDHGAFAGLRPAPQLARGGGSGFAALADALLDVLGTPRTLAELGVTPTQLDTVMDRLVAEGLPESVTAVQARELLDIAWRGHDPHTTT